MTTIIIPINHQRIIPLWHHHGPSEDSFSILWRWSREHQAGSTWGNFLHGPPMATGCHPRQSTWMPQIYYMEIASQKFAWNAVYYFIYIYKYRCMHMYIILYDHMIVIIYIYIIVIPYMIILWWCIIIIYCTWFHVVLHKWQIIDFGVLCWEGHGFDLIASENGCFAKRIIPTLESSSGIWSFLCFADCVCIYLLHL